MLEVKIFSYVIQIFKRSNAKLSSTSYVPKYKCKQCGTNNFHTAYGLLGSEYTILDIYKVFARCYRCESDLKPMSQIVDMGEYADAQRRRV